MSSLATIAPTLTRVALVADELKKLKLDVWFHAALRSGSAYDSQISQQLESAKAVLTCWTSGAEVGLGAGRSGEARAEVLIRKDVLSLPSRRQFSRRMRKELTIRQLCRYPSSRGLIMGPPIR
jgi:hypothetical protein